MSYTRYYYGVVLNGRLADTRLAHTDPWPSFRTLPNRSTARDPENNPRGLFNLWEFMVAPFSSNGHPIGTLGNMPFTGWYNSEGRWVRIKWVGSGPNNVHYSRLHHTFFAVVRVNNIFPAPRPDGEGPGYQFFPYDYPQVIVTWYDGYTGLPAYSETVSPLDLQEPPENP